MKKSLLMILGVLLLLLWVTNISERTIKTEIREMVRQTRAFVNKTPKGVYVVKVVADPDAPPIESALIDKWINEAIYVDSYGFFSVISERWQGRKNTLGFVIFGELIYYSYSFQREAEGIISGDYI